MTTKTMNTHDPLVGAIGIGLKGFVGWIATLGMSWAIFDEWASRVSVVLGIVIAILTIILMLRRLIKGKQ